MTYAWLAFGAFVLGLLALGLLLRRRRVRNGGDDASDQPPRLTPHAQALKLQGTGRYWGYRVESHCRASSRLAGTEYPFSEVPPLPVEGCESSVCKCCLVGLAERRRLADRRSGQDRRRSFRMEDTDRRNARPRRKDEDNSWASYSHL